MFARYRRERILKEIKGELSVALRRRNKEGGQFVCETDIKRIWTLDRIAGIAGGYRWARFQEHIKENFTKILSTLVWIDWSRWESFGDHFLGSPEQSDKNLPIEDATFLGDGSFPNSFTNSQYIFIPVTLEDELVQSSVYSRYTKNHRLPFISQERIGQGSFGEVFKVKIPAGYFKHGGIGKNDEDRCLAAKIFNKNYRRAEFELERQNLIKIKECSYSYTNKNIMLSLMSFQHGEEFIILSDLADLNLDTFLNGKCDKNCSEFTPEALLWESRCLAEALNFLHDGLYIRHRRYVCAHFDLKPQNILVKWRPQGHSSVGSWMITDFGNSRIKDYLSTLGDDPPRGFSPTVPQRVPGKFQAPEIRQSHERVVGTESDMWSFGCIMAFILAFATGGPNNTANLGRALFDGDPSWRNDYFYLDDGSLKPRVRIWLENLQTNTVPQRLWVSKTLDLIFDLLKKSPTERPKASKASSDLMGICTEGGFQFGEPILGIARQVSEPHSPSGRTSPNMPGTSTQNSYQTSDGMSGVSSSRSQILDLTDDISYIRLQTPERTSTAALCSAGRHVAFLSETQVVIHSLTNHYRWSPKHQRLTPFHWATDPITAPHGREWKYISISGDYVALRSGDSEMRYQFHRYHFDNNQWNPAPLPSFDGRPTIHTVMNDTMHLAVSRKGNVLFIGNATLYYYSPEHSLKKLEIKGQLQRCGAAFSPDDKYIYCWSYDSGHNYWYIWDADTLNKHSTKSKFSAPESNAGQDMLFPLSTYFAAFERPNRIFVIKENEEKLKATKLIEPIMNIIGGTSYYRLESGDEALILASSTALFLLQLHSEVQDSVPSLSFKTSFKDKDGIGVLQEYDDSFVLIARRNGMLERRRILIT